MRLADTEDALEWAMNEPVEKRKLGRPSTAMTLPEMITSTVRGPKN